MLNLCRLMLLLWWVLFALVSMAWTLFCAVEREKTGGIIGAIASSVATLGFLAQIYVIVGGGIH